MYTEFNPSVAGNSKRMDKRPQENILSMGLMSQNQTSYSCYTQKGNRFGVDAAGYYSRDTLYQSGTGNITLPLGETIELPCPDGGTVKYAYITQYRGVTVCGIAWVTNLGHLYIAGSVGVAGGGSEQTPPSGGYLDAPLDITPAGETVRFIASAPYSQAGGIIVTCESGKVFGYNSAALNAWPEFQTYQNPLPELSASFGQDNFCVMGDYRSRVIMIKRDRILWKPSSTGTEYNVTNNDKFEPNTDYLGAYLYSAMSNSNGIAVPTGAP